MYDYENIAREGHMKFSEIKNELNIETAKSIVDSLLNVGYSPALVIDKSSFEILYENKRALDLLGDRVGRYCFFISFNLPLRSVLYFELNSPGLYNFILS